MFLQISEHLPKQSCKWDVTNYKLLLDQLNCLDEGICGRTPSPRRKYQVKKF